VGGWVRFLTRALAVVVTVVAAGVAVLIAVGATQAARTIVSVSTEPLRDVTIAVPGLPSAPASDLPGIAGKIGRGERINLLVLGYGGAGHDGAFLSDTVLVASIQPRDATVTLLSVPRDLWVALPASRYSGPYHGKINEAFSLTAAQGDRDAGMKVAATVVGGVVGLGIDRTVALDFHGFRTLVDGVGGVDLLVDRSFTAAYPRNDDADVDPSWIFVSFAKGPQHMDGERALRFSRARYSDGPEGSDFARTARQQKVILAAKDRVVERGLLASLLGLLDTLRDNVRTDLSLADMNALAELARDYDDGRTVHAALTTENVLQDLTLREGDEIVLSALRPRTIDDWSEVQAYVRGVLDPPNSRLEDTGARPGTR
jgi:LCP family protein required for cell wall assembly